MNSAATVRVGRDDGLVAEVIEGLDTDDQVVVSYTGSLEDGEPVIAEDAEERSSEDES